MTHRQFLAWRSWLEFTEYYEKIRPSLTDHLIMQLTERVHAAFPASDLREFDANRWKVDYRENVTVTETATAQGTSSDQPTPPVKKEPTREEIEKLHLHQLSMFAGMLGGLEAIKGGDKLAKRLGIPFGEGPPGVSGSQS